MINFNTSSKKRLAGKSLTMRFNAFRCNKKWYNSIHLDTFWCIWFHQNPSGKKRLGEISDDAFQRVLMQHGRRKCQELSLVKVSLGFAQAQHRRTQLSSQCGLPLARHRRGAPGLGKGCLKVPTSADFYGPVLELAWTYLQTPLWLPEFSPLANGTDLNRQKYAILQTHWH